MPSPNPVPALPGPSLAAAVGAPPAPPRRSVADDGETAPSTAAAGLLSGRDIHESHRSATPLELLFDLTFVVAIAACALQLHHAVVADHLGQGLLGFATTFFTIWWAWVHYTWFASAYDTDDAAFRLLTMVQMLGVLILAAGIPAAFNDADFTTLTAGYVLMRAGLIWLWWRVAREHPGGRATALRYLVAMALLQALWVARLFVPGLPWWLTWAVLMAGELAVPIWAARAGSIPWHAHHIAERYGLFTIIVLGECVLGSSHALAGALAVTGWSLPLASVGFGAASLILALWWVYFLVPSAQGLQEDRQRQFRWGYGHVAIFASLASVGAFISVVADQIKIATADAIGEQAATAAMPGVAAAASAAASAASAAAASASAAASAAATAASAGASAAAAGAVTMAATAATAASDVASKATATALPPTFVISLVAVAVAVYLVSTWWLATVVTPRALRRRGGRWVLALLVLAAVVAAVAGGLPLAWALPLVTLAPVVVIVALSSRRDATLGVGEAPAPAPGADA